VASLTRAVAPGSRVVPKPPWLLHIRSFDMPSSQTEIPVAFLLRSPFRNASRDNAHRLPAQANQDVSLWLIAPSRTRPIRLVQTYRQTLHPRRFHGHVVIAKDQPQRELAAAQFRLVHEPTTRLRTEAFLWKRIRNH